MSNDKSTRRILQPADWPRPRGYSNGIAADGEQIFVAGQVGWDREGRFAEGLPAQVEQALHNILAVLAVAGAGPEHVMQLTWYMLDLGDYEANLPAIGAAYRRVMGAVFPAMTVVEVRRLVERKALVEIEARAVLPAGPGN